MIIEYIYKYIKNSAILLHLINILLVYENVRTSYLLETANINFELTHIDIILIICKELKLHILKDKIAYNKYPRFFIHKNLKNTPNNDEKIGIALDMFKPGGNYYDYTQKRVIYQITEETTNTHLYSEVILFNEVNFEEFEKYTTNKKNNWNNILIKYNLPFKFKFETIIDDGIEIRIQKINENDIQYIINNSKEYINDINNFDFKECAELILLIKNICKKDYILQENDKNKFNLFYQNIKKYI